MKKKDKDEVEQVCIKNLTMGRKPDHTENGYAVRMNMPQKAAYRISRHPRSHECSVFFYNIPMKVQFYTSIPLKKTKVLIPYLSQDELGPPVPEYAQPIFFFMVCPAHLIPAQNLAET
jgi:hypothetical protein